jgi:probable rRNA maturation factor
MRNKVILNVDVADDRWTENVDFDALKVAEELKELVFSYAEADNHEIFVNDKTFEVNVCLSNDEEVHRLNAEFRGIDKPTNVLSFANIDDDEFWETIEDKNAELAEVGDIILAFETMQREADIKQISLYAHYCHLLVHGFLHLLGFNHEEDKEAEEMEGLEVELLAQFSIENPYKDDEE